MSQSSYKNKMVNPHKKTNCDRNYKNFAGAPKIKKSKKIPTYVDLFSGAGGASLGFQMGGFKNIFSVDCDRNSCETYRQNMSHHVLVEDKIENLTKQDIRQARSINLSIFDKYIKTQTTRKSYYLQSINSGRIRWRRSKRSKLRSSLHR